MDILETPLPLAVQRMFSLEGTETFVSETIGVTLWVRTAGAFTGWVTPVGVRGPFNRVKVWIFPFDANLIPSTVRIRIRDTDSTGTILGDDTVSVGPTVNQAYEVVATFASTINSSNPLCLEIFADGRTGALQVGAPDTDYPLASYFQARYAVDAAVNPPSATTQFIPNYPTTGAVQATNYCGFYLVGNPKVARLDDSFLRRLNEDSVIKEMLDLEYEFISLGQSGPLLGSIMSSETGSFSGWGSLVGAQPDFSAARFPIRAWHSGHPITKVRARVRLNDSTGTILGDRTVSVNTSTGVQQNVVIDFETTISGGATPLYFEFMTDGHCGQFILVPLLYNAVNRRYWINENVLAPGTSIEISGGALNQNLYVAFGTVTGKVIDFAPTSKLSKALKIVASTEVLIHLPDKLYAVEGIEFNIYWANIIRSNVSIDQLQLDVVCTKGTQWERFYRVTPVNADSGSYSWVLNVYYGGKFITNKTCTLVIEAKTVGAGATRKVNFIGDSTTIDGRPLAEFLYQQSLTTGLTLALQGSKTATRNNDSTGATHGTMKCDAISGWTINQFYTDPTSPFVFSSAFDYAQYLTANSLSMGASDWVNFVIGLNDFANYTDDDNLNSGISTALTQLDAMIANIKATVSGVRIGLFLTIPAGDQNTFGQTNGCGQTAWRFDRNRAMWVEKMLTHYDGRQAEKLYVFPYNAILDVPNNCQVMSGGSENTDPITVTENAYRPELTFQVSFNGVHPASYGYFQLGAGAFAFMKALK